MAPSTGFINPTWATTADIDFAGNDPTNIVRIGTGDRYVASGRKPPKPSDALLSALLENKSPFLLIQETLGKCLVHTSLGELLI